MQLEQYEQDITDSHPTNYAGTGLVAPGFAVMQRGVAIIADPPEYCFDQLPAQAEQNQTGLPQPWRLFDGCSPHIVWKHRALHSLRRLHLHAYQHKVLVSDFCLSLSQHLMLPNTLYHVHISVQVKEVTANFGTRLAGMFCKTSHCIMSTTNSCYISVPHSLWYTEDMKL